VLWLAAGLALGLGGERVGLIDELVLLGIVGCGIGAGIRALRLPITAQQAIEGAVAFPVCGFPLAYVFC
jgi:hypothetical protein